MAARRYKFTEKERLAMLESARKLTTKFFDFDSMYSTWNDAWDTKEGYGQKTYGEFIIQWSHPDGVTHFAVYHKKSKKKVFGETWLCDWKMSTNGRWRTLDALTDWILQKEPTKRKSATKAK